MKLLLRVLGFLLRLLVLAVTGEWPGGDSDQETAPKPRAPLPRKPASPAKAARKGALDLEAAARAQRAVPGLSRMLADVDTALVALAEPVLEHLRAQAVELPPLRFLALANVPEAQANEAAMGSPLVPVSVSDNFGDTPERWAFLARQVGRTLFDVVPGWAAETYRANRLPPTLFVPPGHATYDADTARAALGVWLPELFADAYATHTLGPGYASVLAASLARPKQPMETLVARAQGRWLAATPPAVVRMHVVFAVLSRLGLHQWEQTLRVRWEAAHGTPDSLYLPLSDGRLMAIPLDFMLAELDEVLVTLLDEPQVSLSQATWLDVPGLAYLHAEHAQAQRAAQAFARGEAVAAPTRILLAGAALALDESLRARPAVAAALSRSIRGADTLEAAPSAYDTAAPAQRETRPTLAAAFLDRALVRDALVIGAAFTPLKPRRFRS